MLLFAVFAASAQNSTLSLGDYDNASVDNDSPKYDATNIYNAPIIPTYNHSGVQMIYTADELKDMAGSKISELRFKYYAETFEEYASKVRVYLQEIDQSAFEKTEDGSSYKWFAYDASTPSASLDFSFNGLDAYSMDGEMVVDLSANPFTYTGKNLLLTVVNDSESFLDASQGYMAFYCYDFTGARIATFAKDAYGFDENQKKDNFVKDGQENMLDRGMPVVKFTYEPAKTDPEQPADGTLTLGEFDNEEQNEAWDGFNLQNAPILFNYNHSGSQVLYLPEQLADMKGKAIKSMTFALFNDGNYTDFDYSSRMKLYLQEIDDVAFRKVNDVYNWFAFDATAPVAELDFTQDFTQAAIDGTDIHITFDLSEHPFDYTGKTLLMTVTNDNSTDTPTENSGLCFRWIKNKPSDDWRTFIYGSDKTDFVTNQEGGLTMGTYDNEDKWKNAPAVRFVYADQTPTGIAQHQADAAGTANGGDGHLALSLNKTTSVQVYTPAGLRIYGGVLTAGNHRVNLSAGLYIVKIGNASTKVFVR